MVGAAAPAHDRELRQRRLFRRNVGLSPARYRKRFAAMRQALAVGTIDRR